MKLNRLSSRTILSMSSVLLCVPTLALAAVPILDPSITACDWQTGQIHAECIPAFLAHFIRFIFIGTGMFFMINVMVAGYQLAIGSVTGDKGGGKDRLRNSIIGLIVTVCVFLIMDLVLTVLIG